MRLVCVLALLLLGLIFLTPPARGQELPQSTLPDRVKVLEAKVAALEARLGPDPMAQTPLRAAPQQVVCDANGCRVIQQAYGVAQPLSAPVYFGEGSCAGGSCGPRQGPVRRFFGRWR